MRIKPNRRSFDVARCEFVRVTNISEAHVIHQRRRHVDRGLRSFCPEWNVKLADIYGTGFDPSFHDPSLDHPRITCLNGNTTRFVM
jgi:hypothetical protein